MILDFPLATKMFQFARLSLACSWIQQAVQKVDLFGNLRIYQFANSMQDEHQSSDCFNMIFPSYRLRLEREVGVVHTSTRIEPLCTGNLCL